MATERELLDTLNRAVAAHQAGNVAEAEHLCHEILDCNPHNVNAQHFLGLIEAQRGRFEQADSWFSQAAAGNPTSPDFHVNHGFVLFALGRFADAIQRYDRAIELRPDNPEALSNRVRVSTLLQRPAAALACYDGLLTIKPDDAERWRNRATALLNLKRREEARASADRALVLEPELAAALDHRGCALLGFNQLPVLVRLPSTHCSTKMALTFDDGPSATTPELLDILKSCRATATFFLLGERAGANPNLVKQIVSHGHAVYAHGFSHKPFIQLSSDDIIKEMDRAEAVISCFRPPPPQYLVRLPYGSGADDPRIHQALRSWHSGCQIASWTISTQDYELSNFGNDEDVNLEIDRRLTQLFETPPRIDRSIVLLHENPHGIAAQSAPVHCLTMARKLIESLAARGYEMIALSPVAG